MFLIVGLKISQYLAGERVIANAHRIFDCARKLRNRVRGYRRAASPRIQQQLQVKDVSSLDLRAQRESRDLLSESGCRGVVLDEDWIDAIAMDEFRIHRLVHHVLIQGAAGEFDLGWKLSPRRSDSQPKLPALSPLSLFLPRDPRELDLLRTQCLEKGWRFEHAIHVVSKRRDGQRANIQIHVLGISYAVFCLKKKKKTLNNIQIRK